MSRLTRYLDDRTALCEEQRDERVPEVVWADLRALYGGERGYLDSVVK